MIGYARVCNQCLSKYPEIRTYDDLKRFQLKKLQQAMKEKNHLKEVFTIQRENIRPERDIFLRIGIDDTDTPYGLCTTYLGALIALELSKIKSIEFIDYPYLVRLNPNIPWKTRGNASVSLYIKTRGEILEELKERILKVVEENLVSGFKKTQPAIVFYYSNSLKIPKELKTIYQKALRDVITVEEALEYVKKISNGVIEIWAEEHWARGIIGALAATGAFFNDYTFELLVYRKRKRWGSKRFVEKNSVEIMDRLLGCLTFDNIEKKRLLITPMGPDPVLLGIRGDVAEALLLGFNILEHEDFDFWCIYKTNQGTNAHVIPVDELCVARLYWTIKVSLQVEEVLKEGNKVIVKASDGISKAIINFYAPTGMLKVVAEKLLKGDWIKITGAVIGREKDYIVLNAEELTIERLVPEETYKNPFCPKCGNRLKSKGKGAFYCIKCGFRVDNKRKIIILGDRKLDENKRILPPPSAHRHFTMPNTRQHFAIFKERGLFPNYIVYPFCGYQKVPLSQLKKIRIPWDIT